MVPVIRKEDGAILAKRLKSRGEMGSEEVSRRVREIVEQVRLRGNEALWE